jgi:DNA topoisomerase-3
MKKIVLAEKPSVGKDIARVLGCAKKTKGYCEGKEYIVTWAMGHLVELADPGEYDERYKTWALDYLPMLPQRMKHRVIRKTSHQFRTIKGLFKRNDSDHLIIATDAGREGELVARWIMRLGGWKGPFSRLWINSQTDTAVREGFKNLRQGQEYDSLFCAAESRAEADWIIGLNVTRALTCKYDARLSAGRVQTPTLAMIIEREREIESFVPEAYWTVGADFGPFKGTWIGPKGITRIKDLARARAIVEKVKGREAIISEVSRSEKSEPPPLAYDLTSLQRDANSRLGFSAKKTLDILQGLYERHKLVTYPRTDSRYITMDMVPTLKDRLRAIQDSPYKKTVQALLSCELKTGSRFVNNRKVTDHHAIIPTEQRLSLGSLNSDERALWNLVAGRFLAVLMPPYRYESITLTLTVSGEIFAVRGVRVIDRGWREVGGTAETDGEREDEDELFHQDLAAYTRGTKFTVLEAEAKQGFTRPPPRYTEGTLLSAMENAGKFIEDRELKKTIAGSGIGTPATRADIIEKLLDKYYVERKGKELVPTSRGYELLDLVPDELKSPELTARWEQRLTRIAEGREKAFGFASDIRNSAQKLVEQIKKSAQQYHPRDASGKPCPVCGKMMLSVRDKTGKKLSVCQSFSCGYEESEDAGYNLARRPSKREKAHTRRLIRKYSDTSKDTATFADLIKASMDKKKNRQTDH